MAPYCPILTPLLVLDWEIEAYCATRPIALRRRRKLLVDLDYMTRIAAALHGDVPTDTVLVRYSERCP